MTAEQIVEAFGELEGELQKAGFEAKAKAVSEMLAKRAGQTDAFRTCRFLLVLLVHEVGGQNQRLANRIEEIIESIDNLLKRRSESGPDA